MTTPTPLPALSREAMTPGAKCAWYYVPRGGYGMGFYVDAVIVRVTPKRVRIEATTASGQRKQTNVHPDSLRATSSSQSAVQEPLRSHTPE